jgi:hypothetical protein
MHSPHEVLEHVEKPHGQQQRNIGLTTSVIAVLLAVATMLANDANTRRIVDETRTADWWEYSAFHDTNARMYSANERLAQLQGQKEAAQEFHKLSDAQNKDAADAKSSAQGLEYDSAVQSRHGRYGEIAELCLEVSIVLCSVALLSGLRLFWHLSFITTAAGIGFIAMLLLH